MGMRPAGELRSGNTIKDNGVLLTILKAQYQTNGRNGGVIRMKLKNITTGSITETVFKDADRLDQVILDRKPMQFLFESAGSYAFMDRETYEQIELNAEDLGDSIYFLKDEMEVEVTMYGEKAIGVELPTHVEFEIIYTEPAVRGDTSGKVLKPAKTSTGYEVQVPAYCEIGDVMRIDTRTGEFVERVKQTR